MSLDTICHEDEPLQRTESQVVKRIKVDEVAKILEERGEPVQQLRRELSQLSKLPGGTAEAEAPVARCEQTAQQLRQLERMQQGFRDFGEDLMEGMLVLDGLSGLAEEDRAARKETLAGIQGLLDDIDSAKPRVARLRGELAMELDRMRQDSPVVSPEPEATPEPAAPTEQASLLAAGRAQRRLPKARVDWSEVGLPVKFSTAEFGREYVLSATLPGLEAQSIRLVRKRGGTLSVQGLRLPDAMEQKVLEQSLAAHLERLPRKQREQLQQEDVDGLAAQLGRGRFGFLEEEFELPRDVDWQGVECSFEEGVLRVVLPRVAMTARGFGGHDLHGHRRGTRSHRHPGGYAGRMHRAGLPEFMW